MRCGFYCARSWHNYPPARKVTIFRTINLNAGRTITFGEDFARVEDLFIKAGEGYRLKPSTFGAAKSITVYLTKTDRIKSIHFDYEAGRGFDEALRSYTRTLGKPLGKSVLDARPIKEEVVFWEDEDTRFELIKRIDQQETTVSSVLFDKGYEEGQRCAERIPPPNALL